MNILQEDGNFKQLSIPLMLPLRIVMNINSLIIYENEDLSQIFKSFNLKDIKVLHPYKKDPEKCLNIGYLKSEVVMCAIQTGRESPKKVIQDWIKDIKDFRDNCKEKPNNPKDILNSEEVQDFIGQIQQRNMRKSLESFDKDSIDEYSKKLKLAQMIAWKALDKEMKYEMRLEKEEAMKEARDKEDAREELSKEQRKRDSLNRAILLSDQAKKAKELKQKIQLQRQLSVIKEEVQNKIAQNRKLLQDRIHRIKKVHERALMKTRQVISDIRMSLTNNMMQAEKKGDMKLCKLQTDPQFRNSYCDKHFIKDYYMNTDCKKELEFCTICCENEFGDMHPEDRELCYSLCETSKAAIINSNKSKCH